MRIALAGLGTVGSAVLRLLRANADLLAARGAALHIVAVSARGKDKTRNCELTDIAWVDDTRALATYDADIIVEVIGTSDGVALDLARAALSNGKHFVTANKALIATHGVELARLAEARGVQLAFEAAVAGAIPVVKLLREGLAANRITSVRGILNGTCNYILTRMGDESMDFATALGEAQKRGYAEADPSADIDGHDTACKLAILSALAFGVTPDLASVTVQGIRGIGLSDLRDAAVKGGRIKLLGSASRSEAGIVQQVQPVFVPFEEPLARVGGSGNMIEITSDFAGITRLGGLGAGGEPTASAIVADLVDIARGHRGCAFGVAADQLDRR